MVFHSLDRGGVDHLFPRTKPPKLYLSSIKHHHHHHHHHQRQLQLQLQLNFNFNFTSTSTSITFRLLHPPLIRLPPTSHVHLHVAAPGTLVVALALTKDSAPPTALLRPRRPARVSTVVDAALRELKVLEDAVMNFFDDSEALDDLASPLPRLDPASPLTPGRRRIDHLAELPEDRAEMREPPASPLDTMKEVVVPPASAVPAPSVPKHPVDAFQGPFAESMLESEKDLQYPPPLPEAHDRFQAMIMDRQVDESLPFYPKWQRQPWQEHHLLWKLTSQISFGLYLLMSDLSKNELQVIAIMQKHVNDVDDFLSLVADDLRHALKDVADRAKFLRLPLDNLAVFEHMLTDEAFQTQILNGNERILHICRRTTTMMNEAIALVKQGQDACHELRNYLAVVQQDVSWQKDEKKVQIFDAMQHNVDGWHRILADVQDDGNRLQETLLAFAQTVDEVEAIATQLGRKQASPNIPKETDLHATQFDSFPCPPAPQLAPIADRPPSPEPEPEPEPLREVVEDVEPELILLKPHTYTPVSSPKPTQESFSHAAAVRAKTSQKSLLRQASVAPIDDLPYNDGYFGAKSYTMEQRTESPSRVTPSSSEHASSRVAATVLHPVQTRTDTMVEPAPLTQDSGFYSGSSEFEKPAKFSREHRPGSGTKAAPRSQKSRRTPPTESPTPGLAADSYFPEQGIMSPPPRRVPPASRAHTSSQTSSTLRSNNNSPLPGRDSPLLHEPAHVRREIPPHRAQNPSQVYSSARSLNQSPFPGHYGNHHLAQPSISTLASNRSGDSSHFDPRHSNHTYQSLPAERTLSPAPLPTPMSEQQPAFYRSLGPVQASPHSPLQRPWTATSSGASTPQARSMLRKAPSQATFLAHEPRTFYQASTNDGMSIRSKTTTRTTRTSNTTKSEKERRGVFGRLKKAFSLSEEEKAAFEQRRRGLVEEQARVDMMNRQTAPRYLDGRRIR